MKTWKLIVMLLLAWTIGACDDEEKIEGETGGIPADMDVKVCFAYEAKTVLKNEGRVLVPLKSDKAVKSALKVTVSAERSDDPSVAREGVDFNIAEKVVTVPAGDTVTYVAVDLLDNAKAEQERTVKLKISSVYGGSAGTPDAASLHIVSNAFVEFEKARWETWESAASETATEEIRNSRFVPLVITGEMTEAATVVLEVTDSSAVEPTHFTVVKEWTVAPGTAVVPVEIRPTDDDIENEDRIFTLKIKEVRGGNLVAGKTNRHCEVKIISEEVKRTLQWDVTSLDKPDNEEVLNIPVSIDKAPSGTLKMKVVAVAAEGAAKAGVDYELLTPEITIGNSCQAAVQVKVLGDSEVNADRSVRFSFDAISDPEVFVSENAASFTLNIKNDDQVTFDAEKVKVVEDSSYQITVKLPAVDRERVITLEYNNTEDQPGTWFQAPQERITLPANSGEFVLPVKTKYAENFPEIAPVLTLKVVEVDGFTLPEAVQTELELVPCDYRKLLGEWSFKIGNYDGNGLQTSNMIHKMTFDRKEWKKSFTVKSDFVQGWPVTVTVLWDQKTGNAQWMNDVPLYTEVGFQAGTVDVYLKTAVQNDQYWSNFKYTIPLVWNAATRTFTWDISKNFGVYSDCRSTGTENATEITWFIFKDLSMTKK